MRRLITAEEYIQDRVVIDPETGCWEWLLCHNSDGYSRAVFLGKEWKAHRLSYVTFVGPIKDGLTIDHLCRNRGCLNPDHLEVVSLKENILRGDGWGGKHRRKTQCVRGHAFDESNTLVNARGWRVCVTCKREKAREASRRRKGYYDRDRTRCKHGHEWTPETTGVDGRGRRFCKRCRLDRERERNGSPKLRVKRTHCPQGHAYTPENTYTYRRGDSTYTYCRECNRTAASRREQKRIAA